MKLRMITLLAAASGLWAQYTPPSGGGSSAVTKVFGRVGDVVATTGDYTAAQVTNAADTNSTYSNPGWITAIANAKVTGLAAVATSGSAADLGSGTLPAGRLPNPSATTLGGTQSKAATTHQFMTSISTSGVPATAQPACGDLSDAGTGCSGSAAGVGPSASAYNATTQSITLNTDTPLTFNTNSWDTCSACTIHSTSVNPTRFTAPSNGYYFVSCSAITASSAPVSSISIRINGSVTNGQYFGSSTTTGNVGLSTNGVVFLNANDYVVCNLNLSASETTLANYSIGQMTKLSSTF